MPKRLCPWADGHAPSTKCHVSDKDLEKRYVINTHKEGRSNLLTPQLVSNISTEMFKFQYALDPMLQWRQYIIKLLRNYSMAQKTHPITTYKK